MDRPQIVQDLIGPQLVQPMLWLRTAGFTAISPCAERARTKGVEHPNALPAKYPKGWSVPMVVLTLARARRAVACSASVQKWKTLLQSNAVRAADRARVRACVRLSVRADVCASENASVRACV